MTERSNPEIPRKPRTWPAIAAMALIGAAAGGWLGYRNIKPLYRSDGIVQVFPLGPDGRRADVPLAVRVDHLRAQAVVANSHQVGEIAIQKAQWSPRGTAVPPEPAALVRFMRQFHVEPEGASLLRVSFTDANPEVAAAGARACVMAYREVAYQTEKDPRWDRSQQKQTRKHQIEQERAAARNQVNQITRRNGTGNLDQIIQFKLAERLTLESGVSRSGHRVAPNGASAAPATAPSSEETPRADLVRERVAALAGELNALVVDREDLRRAQHAESQAEIRLARALDDLIEDDVTSGYASCTIMSTGEVPMLPVRDHRGRLALLMALAGAAGLPVVFLMVLRCVQRLTAPPEDDAANVTTQPIPSMA